MTDWLFAPLSGALSHQSAHQIAPWAAWHARCMVLAWGVLLPLGAIAARFFKVTRKQDWPRELDSKPWWHAHRGLQWAGVLVMTVGLGLAWNRSSSGAATPAAAAHVWAGWAVCVAAWLQVAGALARGSKGGPTSTQMRGDHYDMTPWRRAFERVHKALGWLAVVAAVGVTVLGLTVADAPRWMLLMLLLWWAVLATAFVLLQRQGRCIDTYQAIWGPDRSHPGNRTRPIGWGVRRPLG